MVAHEPKVPAGIGLKPALWKRIEAFARERGWSRSQVIESVLEMHLPAAVDVRNSHEFDAATENIPWQEEGNDGDDE